MVWRMGSRLAAVGLLGAALAVAGAQDDAVARAYGLRMQGETAPALVVLEQELEAHPDRAAAWFELARLEFHRSGSSGELDSAQRAIDRALALDAKDVRALCLAGRIAMYNFILKHHAGEEDEYLPQMTSATTALERALELDPDCHEARSLLVSCYGNNPESLGGDREKAQRHVQELERRSPVDGARARIEFERREPAARLELWTSLAKEHADDARVQTELALQHARMGDITAATSAADRALELDPRAPGVLLDVGVVLAFDQRLDAAAGLLGRYLTADPAPARPLAAYATMLLGRIQQRQGDSEKAKQSIARARELDPDCWTTMRPPPEALFTAP